MTDPWFLIVDALAVFRLTRLVTQDQFPPIRALREWLLLRWPAEDTDFTHVFTGTNGPENGAGRPVVKVDGEWLAVEPHWFGDLISCVWCAGMWVAMGVVTLEVFWDWWQYPAMVLAFSAVAGLLHRE